MSSTTLRHPSTCSTSLRILTSKALPLASLSNSIVLHHTVAAQNVLNLGHCESHSSLNVFSQLKGSVWSKKSFPFFAENMTIRSILNLWWHSEILKLILGVVRGMFTKRLKGTRRNYRLPVNRHFFIWGTREPEFNDDHRRGSGFANI